MKKLMLFSGLFMLSACASPSIQVEMTYKETSEGCVYYENIISSEAHSNINEKGALASKKITYTGTPCKQVIEADLKNGFNKTQSVGIHYNAFGEPLAGAHK